LLAYNDPDGSALQQTSRASDTWDLQHSMSGGSRVDLDITYRADVWSSTTERYSPGRPAARSPACMTGMFMANAELGIGVLKKIVDVDVV